MTILILLFAFSIGYATFIENDFGRMSAKALIYNSWWFKMIFVVFVVLHARIKAKSVIVVNSKPQIPNDTHDNNINRTIFQKRLNSKNINQILCILVHLPQ